MSNRTSCALRGPCLPLALAQPTDQVVCVEVGGGPGLRRHLADMGITPGTRLQVISSGGDPGPTIVRVRGSKIMIGRGMSHKVLVRPD